MDGSHHKSGRRNDPESVLIWEFHNTRSVRKPRTRWEDAVHWDALQIVGIRGWRSRLGGTEEWKCLFREARS